MANIQYIGARYVPKFYENPDDSSNNWKSGESYEPLTVVTYLDDSYTSKITVPASVGDPAANPTYWVKTGNYNAALTALQNTVNRIDNLVGSGSLPANYDDIIDAINEIDTVVNPKYIVYIGDSYTGASSLGANRDKRYSTTLAAKLGLIEKNYAVGGSGFTVGTTYPTQVDNAISDFTTNNLDFNEVKYFVIGGTRNDKDTLTYSTYNTAIRSTLYKIATNFPNARIIVLSLLYDARFMPQYYLRNRGWLCSIIAQYPEINKGVTVIDCHNWLTGAFNNILYEDGANVHPTVAGHNVISERAYSAIMGNNIRTTNYGVHDNNGFINTGLSRSSCAFLVYHDDDIINLQVYIKVSNYTLVPAGTTIFSKQYTTAQIGVYYTGTQTFIAALSDGTRLEFETVVNKTGDDTGNATVTIKNLDAFHANGDFMLNYRMTDGVYISPNA